MIIQKKYKTNKYHHHNNGDIYMEEYEILNYVYKNAKMGSDSTTTLLKELENKDNKITDIVNDILNSYEEFLNRTNLLLEELNKQGKKYNPLITLSADMGIKMQVTKDNSDSSIADMLIKGLTKGEIEMTKKFTTFNDNINNEIKKLIRDFKDFHTNSIKKLKKYL